MCLTKVNAISTTMAMPQEGIGFKLYATDEEGMRERFRLGRVLCDQWMLWKAPTHNCLGIHLPISAFYIPPYPHGFHVYVDAEGTREYLRFVQKGNISPPLIMVPVKYRGLLASGEESCFDLPCVVVKQIYVPTPEWMKWGKKQEVPNAVRQTENA